jgi:hypothetical protein
MDLTMMERVGDRWEKMEGSCSTGRSPPWAVLPVEEEEIFRCHNYKNCFLGLLGAIYNMTENCSAGSVETNS